MEKKIDLSKRLTNKELIDEYLHPKKKSRIKTLVRLHKDIFEDKINIFTYLAYAITAGLLPVLSAYSIYWLINISQTLVKPVRNISDAMPIIYVAGLYCLVFCLLYIASVQLKNRQTIRSMSKRIKVLNQVNKKYSSMDLGLFLDARVQNSLGNYFDAVASSSSGYEGIVNEVFDMTAPFLSFVVFSVIFFRVSPLIPLVGILGVLVAVIAEYRYSVYHSKRISEINKQNRKFYKFSSLSQDFAYGKDIRLFNMKDILGKELGFLLGKSKDLFKDLRKKNALAGFFKALSYAVIDIGVIYLLIISLSDSGLDLASFIMLVSISSVYIAQIMDLSRSVSFVYRECISLFFLYDFLDARLVSFGGEDLNHSDFKNFDIEFDHVYFKYPGSETYVLEDLSFTIKDGQSLAIVGLNGAGKTTITNLLTGLYQPDKGKIYIGGIDSSNISADSLKKIMSIVFQYFEPLAVKVKENISSQDEIDGNIDEGLVVDSLKKANIYDKIASYKNGIDAHNLKVLDKDGIVLSGGENQKLSTARALYRNKARIIIFDEPSSALDALAEEKLYRDFKDMSQKKTSIFISHRLASTRFCDKILLLNKGRAEQVGSHEELLNEQGMYKKLYEKQASYYKEEEKNEEN